jgi:hypothetical protein
VALTGGALPSTHLDPEPDLTTADVLYLNEIRHAAVDLNTPAESLNLIAAGHDTCASLGKGTTVSAAVKTVLQRFYPISRAWSSSPRSTATARSTPSS